jgi:diguanylate cyclase (GGDEF)-like protein
MYSQLQYQTNFFFVGLLILLFFNMIYSKQHFSISNRWFMRLIGIEIIVLLLEVASWIYDGQATAHARLMNSLINFLFYFSNIWIPVMWLNYIDFKIFNSESRLKKRRYYSPYLLIGFIILLINLKTGWIYSFNEANYFRGNIGGTVIFTLYIFYIIYSPIIIILRGKVVVERNIKIATFVFALLPLSGAILQITTQSPMLVWNTVAMAIVAVYIFLELSSFNNDSLTGLVNRRQMEEWLYFRIALANKNDNRFSLIMIDMDKFKAINDKYGHAEGDHALILFSSILNQCFKHKDNISRFAGDEFLISLEVSDKKAIELVIQRLENKLKDFNAKNITEYELACSCGGCVYDPEKHKGYQDLIKDADMEMYKIKELKRLQSVNW